MFAVTVKILSCVVKIHGLLKSTKWRHFENVKFQALSAQCVLISDPCLFVQFTPLTPPKVQLRQLTLCAADTSCSSLCLADNTRTFESTVCSAETPLFV